MPKIIIDAGHGGSDAGDIFENRYEKSDNLRLALEIGEILKNKYHFDVAYTRTDDTYLSQLDRAEIANSEGGDLLLSIHRVTGDLPITRPGLVFYIYDRGDVSETIANNIGKAMATVGFPNYYIDVRRDLPLFRETKMPTIMMGVGNLNFDIDNELIDTQLTAIAEEIARGIAESFSVAPDTVALIQSRLEYSMEPTEYMVKDKGKPDPEYRIRVGEYSRYENASEQQITLISKGFPASITKEPECYAVLVGRYHDLETAVNMERMLRQKGYTTMIMA